MQFTGELNTVSLANLIQLIAGGGLTGKITLSDDPKQALICFENGRIVHAEADGNKGREALMAIFLWQRGNFSFLDDDLEGTPRSFETTESDTIENLIKSATRYVEQNALLTRQNIQDKTVLKRTSNLEEVPEGDAKRLFDVLDGNLPLSQALTKAQLAGSAAVDAIHQLLSRGMVENMDGAPMPKGQTINLPDWVSARLRQDNHDLSQAIVDMVIWIDRVKCWMYQADADLQAVQKIMAQCREQQDANQSTGDK
jgi:hypothetical protein